MTDDQQQTEPVRNAANPARKTMAKKLSHIGVIAGSYPSPARPYAGMFVDQLVRAIARKGTRCTVIAPLPFHDRLLERLAVGKAPTKPIDANGVSVVRPLFLSLGNKRLGPVRSYFATQLFFERAVMHALRGLDERPDALYGHFLYPSGATAARVGRTLGIPAFAACGEGSMWTLDLVGTARARRELCDLTGAVAVSTVLEKALISRVGIPEDQIGMFPNGVDREKFYPRDRQAMRKKFGLPPEKLIVAFVGTFNHDKGAIRVADAMEGIEGVGAVYVGKGEVVPGDSQTLFKGVLPHASVPEMLSAADLFVLPTLIEGSCNAIIEAMACGLPVVTSRDEFNDDIVDDSVALRVDPLDVAAIRGAIITLKEDAALRSRMGTAALEKARHLDINTRAERICSFIASFL